MAARADSDSVSARVQSGDVEAVLHASYGDARKTRRFSIEGEHGRIDCDLVGGAVAIEMDSGLEAHEAPTGEPLLHQWLAMLDGRGSLGAQGVEVLALALELGSLAPMREALAR